MIPSGFGLAIGNSGPVGHALGHSCHPDCPTSACPSVVGTDALCTASGCGPSSRRFIASGKWWLAGEWSWARRPPGSRRLAARSGTASRRATSTSCWPPSGARFASRSALTVRRGDARSIGVRRVRRGHGPRTADVARMRPREARPIHVRDHVLDAGACAYMFTFGLLKPHRAGPHKSTAPCSSRIRSCGVDGPHYLRSGAAMTMCELQSDCAPRGGLREATLGGAGESVPPA
jgi:hypothetical protein